MNSIYGQATRVAQAKKAKPALTVKREQTRIVEVFMAGDTAHACQVIRRFCRESPCCVTVTPTTFIYNGGEEHGFVVGLRNYPRFPADAYTLRSTAGDIAERLVTELGQKSYMVVDAAGMTEWSSYDA